jgi:hypothetical protein
MENVALKPLPPSAPPSEIETMVRHPNLQERVSDGDGVAFQKMSKHLRALHRKIFDAPPETREKEKKTHALVALLLGGGNGRDYAARTAPIV